MRYSYVRRNITLATHLAACLLLATPCVAQEGPAPAPSTTRRDAAPAERPGTSAEPSPEALPGEEGPVAPGGQPQAPSEAETPAPSPPEAEPPALRRLRSGAPPEAAPEPAPEEPTPATEPPEGETEEAAAPPLTPAAPAAETPPRPTVLANTHTTREEAVRRSLQGLSPGPEQQPLTEADRLAAVASLLCSARMQLAAFQTEHASLEQERDKAIRRGKELKDQASKLPGLLRAGKLPLLYVENARDRAEETVADMNELFDRAIARRATLSKALKQYREDVAEARRLTRGLPQSELRRNLTSGSEALQRRLDAVQVLIALLDEIISETVDASEAGAELSLQLTQTIRATSSRRLFAQTAPPMSLDSLRQIGSEWAASLESSAAAIASATKSAARANPLLSALLSAAIAGLFALLWWGLTALPGRLVADSPAGAAVPPRLVRAARLLVPVGRAVLLMALAATLARAWRLPEDWSAAIVWLLAAWVAYFLLLYALRELLAPQQPQFRILDIRQQAAEDLYAILTALALYTVALLPLIALLNGMETRPAETIRLLQIALGVGLLGIAVARGRRARGLRAAISAPDTPHEALLRDAFRLIAPLIGLGILGGVVAAAGGFSNLSAYLSRALSLELLLLIGAVLVDGLVLQSGDGQDSDAWHPRARWGFWGAVVALQAPIWQLQAYHATYLYALLARPITVVEGREITGLSVFKGLLLALLAYAVARFARERLNRWRYLTERFQSGVAYAFSSLAFYIMLAAGVLWAMLISGFELSMLTVFAGMAGIGIGFGLQDMVKDFISGLVLLIERPVAVGDFVDLGDLRGWITAINLRSTTIRDRENNIVLVPNSDLTTSRLTNLTISDPVVRVSVAVGVSYNSDLRLVREVLLQAGRHNELALSDPEPRVVLRDFGDSSVDFELWVWVADASVLITVEDELRTYIWDAFAEHNIEIPFPQQDLHLRSSDIPLPYSASPSDEDQTPRADSP